MNTLNNPAILTEEYVNRDDGSGDYYFIKTCESGEYISKELAEEMLELLEDSLLQLEYLNHKFTATGTTNSLLLKLQTIILKAKG